MNLKITLLSNSDMYRKPEYSGFWQLKTSLCVFGSNLSHDECRREQGGVFLACWRVGRDTAGSDMELLVLLSLFL
jgi:hypothetical protein